ncbi:hypothetical protein RchiOBHm_Chr2g0171941 [Rosa chinensis]|uniref:Uncharacterized protein n=1 Tax=Rosa chinensis TaxID=74649 RepID=A0A2P6S5H5_ROSCH|nr:hypothetical protein RchiOBHm_Chr2g0171941 [Rosa chinensis]
MLILLTIFSGLNCALPKSASIVYRDCNNTKPGKLFAKLVSKQERTVDLFNYNYYNSSKQSTNNAALICEITFKATHA